MHVTLRTLTTTLVTNISGTVSLVCNACLEWLTKSKYGCPVLTASLCGFVLLLLLLQHVFS